MQLFAKLQKTEERPFEDIRKTSRKSLSAEKVTLYSRGGPFSLTEKLSIQIFNVISV